MRFKGHLGDTLVQAQATDAGYAALAPIAKGLELAAAAENGRHQDVARLLAERIDTNIRAHFITISLHLN